MSPSLSRPLCSWVKPIDNAHNDLKWINWQNTAQSFLFNYEVNRFIKWSLVWIAENRRPPGITGTVCVCVFMCVCKRETEERGVVAALRTGRDSLGKVFYNGRG